MSPDVAASVKARLLTKARSEQEEFERTLTRFAAERLLYRLGASTARERCILKGASLLTAWVPDPYRATRDIDVLAAGPTDDAAIRTLVEEICAVTCPEDGLRFDVSRMTLEPIRPEEEYSGRRARFLAYLGSARISVQIDFGSGDALATSPDEIAYPTILSDLPSPHVRAYPREATVAEKVEAMVKLDRRNSRMKDFHDVWALSTRFAFDGRRLRRSIAACFERRGTPWTSELPRCLTSAFYQDADVQARWRSYLAAGAVLVAPPAQFERIGERVIAFVTPVRDSVMEGQMFDSAWAPGGPWSPISARGELAS